MTSNFLTKPLALIFKQLVHRQFISECVLVAFFFSLGEFARLLPALIEDGEVGSFAAAAGSLLPAVACGTANAVQFRGFGGSCGTALVSRVSRVIFPPAAALITILQSEG